MAGPCKCTHCRGPAAGAEAASEPQVIALPAKPTPIRVHTAHAAPLDCVLHPDGSLTARMGGEVRRNFLSFADMRERNWADARIEFNPGPLSEPPVPDAAPVVQGALL